MGIVKDKLAKSAQVVATVTQSADLDFLESAGSVSADILEYRLDNLFSLREEAKASIEIASVPAMATVRSPEEGGAHDLTPDARRAIYDSFFGSAAIVDTEVATLQMPEFSDFVKEAGAKDTLVLASFHDFQQWPGENTLREKIDRAYETGADIAKVAVFVDSMSQLFELVRLVEFHRAEGRLISAMGMGPLGKLSRLVLARAGSCLNYGYLQIENAPGQWSAAELMRLLKEI